MDKNKIGIVILNWNNSSSTIKLLNSIKKFESSYCNNLHIYVVDNGSDDNSVEELKNYFDNKDEFKEYLLISEVNSGYARGNNIGIRKAIEDECNFILVLNNDIELVMPITAELLKTFNYSDNIGIVTLKILNNDLSTQKWCTRKRTKVIHRFLIYSPFNRFIRKTSFYNNYFYGKKLEDATTPFEIELFSGAAFMIEADLFNNVGLFDEKTFLYEEELILSDKISRHDKKIFINPEISVVHQDGETTSKIGPLKYFYMIESENYYLNNYAEENLLGVKKIFLKLLRNTFWVLKLFSSKDYFKFYFKSNSKRVG